MSESAFSKTVTLAITGASGAQYGLRLLQCLLAARVRVWLLLSDAARMITGEVIKVDSGQYI